MLTLQQPPQQVKAPNTPRQTMQPRGRIRDEQGGTFRLLCGVHLDYGPKGCDCDSCFFWEEDRQSKLANKQKDIGPNPNHRYEAYDDYTNPNGSMMGGYIARCYHERTTPIPREQYTNDIVISNRDLDRRHNGPKPDMKKFARLGAETLIQPALAPPPTPFPLKEMTVGQLLAIAAEEEIDLATITPKDRNAAIKKEDLMRLIEQSGKYA